MCDSTRCQTQVSGAAEYFDIVCMASIKQFLINDGTMQPLLPEADLGSLPSFSDKCSVDKDIADPLVEARRQLVQALGDSTGILDVSDLALRWTCDKCTLRADNESNLFRASKSFLNKHSDRTKRELILTC